MPGPLSRQRQQRPIEYRDRQGRIWHVSEVAQLKVVSPAIDGPNLCLVIRFEREGEERFARWIGGVDWRWLQSLHRLFAEAEVEPSGVTSSAKPIVATAEAAASDEELPRPVGPAPRETVALWCKLVASMGPDELDSFEQRTFAAWERASLGALRIAIHQRRRELAR